MLCRKCGKEIPDESVYCYLCGVKQERKTTHRKRGNKQGTAIKRGQTWTAVWTENIVLGDGRTVKHKRRWKGGFSTKTAALVYAADPPKPAAVPVEYKPTLGEYYETWKNSDYLDLSASKQCAFRIAWGKLEDLHGRTVADLTIAELQACVDDKAETHYPARDMRTLLSHLFKRAVAEGQARTNLSQFIRIPPLNETEQEPFTGEEIAKIWQAWADGERMAGLILLMIYSGMMPGELTACKLPMIDTVKREIVGCGIKTTKRKKTQIIYPECLDPVVEMLIASTTSPTGYILSMSRDKFYDGYHAALGRIGVRDLPPYSCRHTTATALAMIKTAPSLIQEIMRHTKFTTTQRYIHPDMDSAHAAINALDSPANKIANNTQHNNKSD